MPRFAPLAALAAGLFLGAPWTAAEELAPGITLLAGEFVPGRQPDGNTLLLAAPEGLIVVDSGRHLAHTRAIVAWARAAGRPVAVVVNTHWHLDHIGGNALLRREYPGLQVVASGALEAALDSFLAGYRRQLEGMLAGELPADQAADFRAELALLDAAPALAPDQLVTAGGARRLAGRGLELGLERRAATAGDVWLLDPETRTLAAGDLVTLPVPFLDTACPAGWLAALDRLAAVDFVRLVPGHGAPLDRAGFARYRTAFANLLACAARETSVASCADGWLGDLGELLAAAEHGFTRQLLDYYVGDVLRGDPQAIAARCAS